LGHRETNHQPQRGRGEWRAAWLDAVINDPLLPGRILPSDYLGQQAWRRRVEVLRAASRQLRTFKPE
jgi:DNA-binding transcriptional regulator PaaX